MEDKFIAIKCPHCGWEYIPEEIFVKLLNNKTYVIERDEQGRILQIFDHSLDLTETFICENCGKQFNISADISFKTEKCCEINFDDDFVSPIYNSRTSLDEPEF